MAKYGKFIKPKTYNLHENNLSQHQDKYKAVRIGSNGHSITNINKFQT